MWIFDDCVCVMRVWIFDDCVCDDERVDFFDDCVCDDEESGFLMIVCSNRRRRTDG